MHNKIFKNYITKLTMTFDSPNYEINNDKACFTSTTDTSQLTF